LRVFASFFEAGDALNAADGVFVEDVVVADPEFEGEAGAEGNEAVERGVVANRPRKAAEKDQGEGSDWDAPGEFGGVVRMDGGPKEQERECNAQCGIGEEREGPEDGVGEPEFLVGRVGDEQSEPDESGGEEDRERSVPDPFERHQNACGMKDPEPSGGDGDVSVGDAASDSVKRKGDG